MIAAISCIFDNLVCPYHTDMPRSAIRPGPIHSTCLDSSELASVARKLILTPSHVSVDMIDV